MLLSVRFYRQLLTDILKMKQIAYLLMIFLPPSFAAVRFHCSTSLIIDAILRQCVFRMNVVELNPQRRTAITNLFQYVALILPLMVVTFWIFFAFKPYFFPEGISFYKRLGWPKIVVIDILRKCLRRNQGRKSRSAYLP